MQVWVDRRVLVDGQVTVLQGRAGALDHHLLQVSVGGAEEDDGVVAGGGGGDGGEVRPENQHGHGGDRDLAAQRRVHVQAAEVLADRLQLR